MARRSGLALPALLLLLCAVGAAQESADQLVAALTYDRSGAAIDNLCGAIETDRLIALELAHSGNAAVPKIEKALDAVDAGQASLGLNWLQLVYAHLQGRDAYYRLRHMELAPRSASEE